MRVRNVDQKASLPPNEISSHFIYFFVQFFRIFFVKQTHKYNC